MIIDEHNAGALGAYLRTLGGRLVNENGVRRIVGVAEPDEADVLAFAKGVALAEVDAAAGRARAKVLTVGTGQSLEYDATAAEALRADGQDDPLDPEDFPMLEAERLAHVDAGLADPTLRGVVTQVLSQRAAWLPAGAAIKRLRRAAKIKIDAATTFAEVNAAAAVDFSGAE